MKAGKVTIEPLPFELLHPHVPLIGTLYSPSGGVGKSSMAMNLAAYIAACANVQAEDYARRYKLQAVEPPRILVLDGDIVHGSLAVRLRGETKPSIYELTTYLDERAAAGMRGRACWPQHYSEDSDDSRPMRDFVMWPESLPNLNLLAGPEDPDRFFDFKPIEYREILRLLAQFYSVIIVDSGTEIVMESQRTWLSEANHIFMLTAPDIDRIWNAGKSARYLMRSKPHPRDRSANPRMLPPLVERDQLSLVMTRYDSDSGIDPESVISQTFPWLDNAHVFMVPDVTREMTRANNRGRFLVLESQLYADIIAQAAQRLFASYSETPQER